jgi:hypothetical protein
MKKVIALALIAGLASFAVASDKNATKADKNSTKAPAAKVEKNASK